MLSPDLNIESDSLDVDVMIVGAGIAGLYALHRLRRMGLSVVSVERGPEVGGTWFWNRYPGARVDTYSLNYSYSFDPHLQKEWTWSERFARQPELLRYLQHVADRFDLRRDIRFGTAVTAATFDESSHQWRVETEPGLEINSQFLISAAGVLSATNLPPFPGLDSFRGTFVHTSQWPMDLDLSGKRVGLIGTGSTGVQIMPELARVASHLDVFQRTANFCIPQGNGPISEETRADWGTNYPAYREIARQSRTGNAPPVQAQHFAHELSAQEREQHLEDAWGKGAAAYLMAAFKDVLTDAAANGYVADFVRHKIRSIVQDSQTAELLCPQGYFFGTKRPVLENGYYESFNRTNVTLVDVRNDPIVSVTPSGLKTASGEFPLDVIVFATGFDAITGPLLRLGVVGRGGQRLDKAWSDGPRTYLGATTAGFPNFFFITGPGSPSVLGNMVTGVELHVDWVADLIAHMRNQGLAEVEVSPEAEEEWTNHVQETAGRTLYTATDSWFMGANIPGKPRVFLPYVGGIGTFREFCERARIEGYPGLRFRTRAGDGVDGGGQLGDEVSDVSAPVQCGQRCDVGVDGGEVSAEMRHADGLGGAGGVFAVQVSHERGT